MGNNTFLIKTKIIMSGFERIVDIYVKVESHGDFFNLRAYLIIDISDFLGPYSLACKGIILIL